jgi:hypothetical protein
MAKYSKRVHGTRADFEKPVPRRIVDAIYFFPTSACVVPAHSDGVFFFACTAATIERYRDDVCNICIHTILKNHEEPVMRAAKICMIFAILLTDMTAGADCTPAYMKSVGEFY